MGKHSMKIRKGDTVKVIAGKDKGAEGRVIQVLREEQRVVVEGVNRVKKHTKVVQQGGRGGTTGGIITTEAPIHVSNVMLVEGDGVTRVGFRREEVLKRRPDGSTYAGTRSVTFAPIGMPSRSLNCAIDLVARRTSGFWPVIVVKSRTAPSISLASRAASPTPMLTTILVRPGTCMTLPISNSLRSAGRISSR